MLKSGATYENEKKTELICWHTMSNSSSTVCPGSSDPPEKIFASENEVYTIFQLLQYFRLNIIRLQSKIILGHMN